MSLALFMLEVAYSKFDYDCPVQVSGAFFFFFFFFFPEDSHANAMMLN